MSKIWSDRFDRRLGKNTGNINSVSRIPIERSKLRSVDRQDRRGNLICESAAKYSFVDLYGRQGMSSRLGKTLSVSRLCRAPNYRIRLTLALALPAMEVVLFW